MWWNNFINGMKDFFNQPVAIIGCSVGFLLISILWIIAKTSIGKKALKSLTSKITELKGDYAELKTEYEIKSDAVKKYYEEKLALIEHNTDAEKELLVVIAENLRNVNISKALEEYKNRIETINISEVVESKVSAIKSQYEKEITEFKEYLQAEFDKKIAEIKVLSTELGEKHDEIVEYTTEQKEVVKSDIEKIVLGE